MQYGWLCLCQFMDLEPSFNLSPAVRAILEQIAGIAFTAVGRKKRFKLQSINQITSPPATSGSRSMCCPVSLSTHRHVQEMSTVSIADAQCWQTV